MNATRRPRLFLGALLLGLLAIAPTAEAKEYKGWCQLHGNWYDSEDCPGCERNRRENALRARAHALNEEGRAAHEAGDYDRAISLYRQAADTYPDPVYGQNLISARAGKANAAGDAALAAKSYGRAADFYREAMRIDPSWDGYRKNLANAQANQANAAGNAALDVKDYNRAADYFREAMRLDPSWVGYRKNLARAHNDAGIAAREAGDYDRAISFYREAMRNDPSVGGYRENLAHALANKANVAGNAALDAGDYDRAIRLFGEAVEQNPAWEGYRQNLARAQAGKAAELNTAGWAALDTQDPDKAIRLFREATRLHPGEQKYRDGLALSQAAKSEAAGDAALAANDYGRAIRAFREAVEFAPLGRRGNLLHALDTAAQAALKEGNLSQAAAYCEEMVSVDPRYLSADPAVQKFGADLRRQKESRGRARGIQQGASRVAERVAAAPAPVDNALDFDDLTESDLFGTRKAKPQLDPAPARNNADGSTKAGEQLQSAAATAAQQRDLGVNYDTGGAPAAGDLVAGGKDLTLSTGKVWRFSEKARQDPRVIASLAAMDELQQSRQSLDAERQKLAAERNHATDAATMTALTQRLDAAEQAYQAKLVAIYQQDQELKKLEKLHRTVDDEVEGEGKTPEK